MIADQTQKKPVRVRALAGFNSFHDFGNGIPYHLRGVVNALAGYANGAGGLVAGVAFNRFR
ncbi:MAG: hypothetical protein ACRD9Y_18160 [Blastocatellia bacterium]